MVAETTCRWSVLQNSSVVLAARGFTRLLGRATADADFRSDQGPLLLTLSSNARDGAPQLTAASYAVVLRPPANALVYGLKYDDWSGLARLMGERMARSAIPRELLSGRYLIASIPTTRRRARTRGYNQAEVLAEAVVDRVDMPLVGALERRQGGSTQVGLHPAERRANVRRAFTVRAEARATLKGARVLLVDDVLTTGSTAMEAARPLVQAGATKVFLSAFARALPYLE